MQTIKKLANPLLLFCIFSPATFAESPSRITNEYIPLQVDAVPDRPKALEIGDGLLEPGTLTSGFTLPTGAVWQPSLLLYGSFRTALQTYDDGNTTFSEWVNRLNLFANLRLSGTERLLIGVRPLDDKGEFTGQYFEPDNEWHDATNLRLRTAFFEGDIGELFPRLDPNDNMASNIGFSIGRQPLNIQEGMLINDTIDSLGLVWNNLELPGAGYWRLTALYGWNQVNRDNNREDDSAKLFGLFNEIETKSNTITVDLAYIDADETTGSGFYAGVGSVQRIKHLNTAFRVNTSVAQDEETPAVSSGTLLFAEISWTPQKTRDLAYMNFFWGIDEYASASRDAAVGGPLGRVGLLFAAPGMGRYKPALGNRADNSVGGAVGYQKILRSVREQFIVELGGRTDTNDKEQQAIALGVRYQHAFGQHTMLQLDGYAADIENQDTRYGMRLELLFKF